MLKSSSSHQLKMNNFWKNKRVLLTGSTGFLGTHLLKKLKDKDPVKITLTDSKKDDLRISLNCKRVVKNQDIIIHLAAIVGGIGFNRQYPATMFYDNAIMGLNLMEEARKAKVKKFVSILTVCSYPKLAPIPFKESSLWDGYPEETNAPYGLAKKMLLVQGQAYKKQYGFNSIHLIPSNLYGPGDKSEESHSHVIPALIKKVYQAQKNHAKNVVVWGTGKPTREFLYVEDAVEGIVKATEKYNNSEPVNLGTGTSMSISKLTELIAKLMDFKGKIVFDKTKPDGQPKRNLDITLAKKEFGFQAKTKLEAGLVQTINWYVSNNRLLY